MRQLLKKFDSLFAAKNSSSTLNEKENRKAAALQYITNAYTQKWVEFYQPAYDPNSFLQNIITSASRENTQKRVEFITANLPKDDVHSYIDIGSQIGYFVFKMQEWNNLYSIGIEMNSIAHNVASQLSAINGRDKIGFINSKIDASTVKSIPSVDVISFLNVFHHINHFDSFDAANNIVQTLQKKCKYFIFETGQYNEKGYYWSEDLSFMGNDSDNWIKEYLKQSSFEIIASHNFTTHLSDNTRLLCVCRSI